MTQVGKDSSKDTNTELLQFVSFNLGDEEYAIEILKVQEIIRMVDVTRVPNSPDFINGVINLRGRVIPVLDLGKRIGLPEKVHSVDGRIIVVEIQNKVIGFIVDKVNIVLRINQSIVEPTPELVGKADLEFINGIAKMENSLLILLNLDKVISQDQVKQLAAV
ncbi:MAG: chemotaxis protein CheW [Candidatus Kapaibacterium sp.]